MEDRALVVQWLAGGPASTAFASAQGPEVLARARCRARVQLEYDAPGWQTAQLHVEEAAHWCGSRCCGRLFRRHFAGRVVVGIGAGR